MFSATPHHLISTDVLYKQVLPSSAAHSSITPMGGDKIAVVGTASFSRQRQRGRTR